MTAVDRLLETARAEIGYLEKKTNSQLDSKTANAGSGNWTKYADSLDGLGVYNGKKNGYAWCDVFVDWCFIQTFGLELGMRMTGQTMGGYGAGCTYSANYYKKLGRFYTENPQPGDQIFFSKDGGKTMNHTGIVEKVTQYKVYTIEGNTSSTAGVVANGGAVRGKSYTVGYTKIAGYGRPDWNLFEEVEMEFETRVSTLERKLDALVSAHASLFNDVGIITAQLNKTATQYNTLAELPEYARPTIEKLVKAGAIQGDGRTDEQGNPAGLGLSTDMVRTFVVLDRIGVFE